MKGWRRLEQNERMEAARNRPEFHKLASLRMQQARNQIVAA